MKKNKKITSSKSTLEKKQTSNTIATKKVQPKIENISSDEWNLTIHTKTKKNKNYKTWFLTVGNFMNNKKTTDFYKLMDNLKLINPKMDELIISTSSAGGLVIECQYFINELQSIQLKFKKYNREDKITNTIVSHASSAGAFSFITFKNRYIYPNSRIMFHESAGGTNGKLSTVINKIKFDKKHIGKFLENAKKYFTKKEWKRLQRGKDFWLEADTMIKRDICNGIIINGKLYKIYNKSSKNKALSKLNKFYKNQDIFYKG
jgi:ATP-dependent protease ClpP protease subunit